MIIFIIIFLQLLFLGTVIFLESRDPARTIVWLLILGTLPVLGALLFLVFGRVVRRYRLSKREEVALVQVESKREEGEDGHMGLPGMRPVSRKLEQLLSLDAMSRLTYNNRWEVLTNGDETFRALMLALFEAKDHIHMEYYIFQHDMIGWDIVRILRIKVADGVKVRILVDGLGSWAFIKSFRHLKKLGIEAAEFYPIRFPFLTGKLNLRNHRKIVVVDGQIGFTGGLNVGDEYLSRSKQLGFWRDTFVKLEGDAVQHLQAVFLHDWSEATKEKIEDQRYFPPAPSAGSGRVQIVASGPDSNQEAMLQVFFVALTNAEKSIYLETPYFIPDESSMMALKTAALSGLDVRIIVQGVPEYQITYWAARSFFMELLAVGVRIYSYKKGILHAKILIIDGEIGSVGSTNFDERSFRLNFEVTSLIYDSAFAQRLEWDFKQDMNDSEEIWPEEFEQRPLGERVKESFARLFSPLL
ncbi:MAG: cardiolipin synthase [Peptococcaceae bacterium]|nr:cardiolipin synthase [Peptococcaceae bacterium]